MRSKNNSRELEELFQSFCEKRESSAGNRSYIRQLDRTIAFSDLNNEKKGCKILKQFCASKRLFLEPQFLKKTYFSSNIKMSLLRVFILICVVYSVFFSMVCAFIEVNTVLNN